MEQEIYKLIEQCGWANGAPLRRKIYDYLRKSEGSPTIYELATALGATPSSVAHALRRMAKAGILVYGQGKRRYTRLLMK